MSINDSTILRLSVNALDKLFPVGSEVRVQLQQAVLAETAGRWVKGILTEEVRDTLRRVSNDVAKQLNIPQLIAEQFNRPDHWSQNSNLQVKPGSQVSTAIADHIKDTFRENLRTRIQEMLEQSIAECTSDEYIKSIVDYEVRKRVRPILHKAVELKIAEVLAPVE